MNNVILTQVPLADLRQLISESVQVVLEKNNSKRDVPEESDQLLKINDVCKLFGVSRVTVHNWKRAGILPFFRVARTIYFRKSSLVSVFQATKSRSTISEGGAR